MCPRKKKFGTRGVLGVEMDTRVIEILGVGNSGLFGEESSWFKYRLGRALVTLKLGYCACARSIEVGVAGSLDFAASATLRRDVYG